VRGLLLIHTSHAEQLKIKFAIFWDLSDFFLKNFRISDRKDNRLSNQRFHLWVDILMAYFKNKIPLIKLCLKMK